MSGLNAGILTTKKHFEVLDGLRGVAALAVVIFHFMEWVYSDYTKNFIGRGFLAVDFFFCLSGFVIAYAYDSRIKLLGTLEFFKARLIRLQPLVILGSILGLIGFFLDPFAPETNYSAGWLSVIFLASAFLIPFPVMEDRAFNLFGLNAPAWSLFWEYMANILYAFVLYKLQRRWLMTLVILAAITLSFVAFSAGNLLGGWSGGTFWHGGARVFYSFLAGMLIFRCNWIINNKLGFGMLAVLLSLAFVMPSFKINWLAELLVVVFYFPLIVSLGAGAVISPSTKRLCRFSGNISYPLYMTHYAAIWVFGHYFTSMQPDSDTLLLIISIGTVLLIGFAYIVQVLYDSPIRKYLLYKTK